jgi:CheY-like chemotaxis protein
MIPRQIQADPTRIRQNLINLLGNAIKFTDTGSVTLEIYYSPSNPDELSFDVIDTGIGMTAKQQASLFRPFTQADVSMTRKFGGTGLGLTICKRLAEMMKGDVFIVSSTEGVGTRFRFRMKFQPAEGSEPMNFYLIAAGESGTQSSTIPSSPNNPSTPSSPPTQSVTAKLEGLHVLVAEDGPDNQKLIRHHLTKAGAKVTIVENGQLAVDEIKNVEKRFDIVLMDMQMPVMDGYTATGVIRSLEVDIPVVALTAHAMSGDREKCIDAGCSDYLTKPIEKQKLVDMVLRYVSPQRVETPSVPSYEAARTPTV